jgi:hypothetical protein
MDLGRRHAIRAQALAVWGNVRRKFMRLPATVRVMLGLFLLAALLMAFHTTFSEKDANLQLKVQHSLRSGQISVWLDGDLAYSGSLVGNAKRKFGLFPFVQGSLLETFPVAPGAHQIKVQVVSDTGVRESSISGDFAHHGQRTLSASVGRGDLSLNWRPETAGTEPPSSSPGWFSRYAGTLMMTIAGSIISALTGFALRELPKRMVSSPREAQASLENQPSSS